MCTQTNPGCLLPCPKCGEVSATIALNLGDMQTFTCQECSEEFDRSDIESFIAKWQRLFAWIDTAPKME